MVAYRSAGWDANGKQITHWVGRFATKRERDDAVAKARTERPWEVRAPEQMTCGELADRYEARFARLVERRERKQSSLGTVTQALKTFRKAFGDRPIASISPIEAEDWVQAVPSFVPARAVALFNYAERMRLVDHNPFDGLGGVGGRVALMSIRRRLRSSSSSATDATRSAATRSACATSSTSSR